MLSSKGFVQYCDLIYHWTDRFLILKLVLIVYIENCVADFLGTKSFQLNEPDSIHIVKKLFDCEKVITLCEIIHSRRHLWGTRQITSVILIGVVGE